MLFKKKQFWGTVIAVALLAFCFKDIRISEIQKLVEQVDFIYLGPAILCAFLYVSGRALRWRIIVSQQKLIPMFRAINLYSAGQILNIVMPMLTGQVGRLFLFSKNEGIRKTVIFSTIILEVVFDAISLVVFLFLTSLAFVFPEGYGKLSFILLFVTVVVVIALYLLLNFQTRIEEYGRRHLRERSPSAYIGIKKFIRSFTKGIEALRSSQHIIGSLFHSIMSWTMHAFVVYFLLKSFGFDLPFAAATAIMIINTLALMIPITPGNAGTFELAVSSSLMAFSVGRSDAVLFALALHLLDLLPIFVLGFIFLHQERVSIRKIKMEHEEEVIFDKVDEEGVFVEEEERI